MRNFNRNDQILLKDNARPKAAFPQDTFNDQTEHKDSYYGLPLDSFEISGNSVYLSSEVASQIVWNVDGVMPDSLNIASYPRYTDPIEISGEKYHVNPGFWCSYVEKSEVKKIV